MVLGCEVTEKENSEFYLFFFFIYFFYIFLREFVADPPVAAEEEEVSLCSLRVCDAETQTDRKEVEDDNELFLF